MKPRFPLVLATALVGLGLLAEDGAGAPVGRVAGVVELVDEGGDPIDDRSGAVVSLEGVPGPLPDGSRDVHAIHQRNKQFHPRQLVVLKGATIDFPNDDRIDHNVFSLSRTLRFDLGLYRSGASKQVVARRPGVIDVFCNIHSEMSAKILVLETPHHAETGRDGRYELKGIPPGKYKLRVWHARGEAGEADVVVKAGATTEHPWRVRVGDAPRRHLRKNGTPYGRYQ